MRIKKNKRKTQKKTEIMSIRVITQMKMNVCQEIKNSQKKCETDIKTIQNN